MTGTFLRRAACGLLILAAFPAYAAPAPQTVADMLTAAVAASGQATFTYDSVTGEGDTVTLAGAKLTATDGTVASVPSLILTGVAERTPGGFTAARVTADQGTATGHGETTTWATAALEGVIVPSADEVKARARIRPFAKATAGTINISGADLAAPVDVASVTVEVGDVVEGSPSAIQMHATGVRLPAALLSNSLFNAVIVMLDYKAFLADITFDGEYDTTADTVAVRALTIDAATVGKITLAGKASGFSVKGLTTPEMSKEARANARLDKLTVRLDNAGFVERLLDKQAEMLGGTRDDVRSQMVDFMLPFALSFVDNVAFRDQFLAATATFLKDPRSLTITFSPEKPVPLGQVMRTAARSPASLPDLLTPTVEANN